jgi:hypothetical protein
MGQFKDITGQKFNRLTALSRSENRGKTVYWLCECECGAIKEVAGASLRCGKTKSCGCLNVEVYSTFFVTHGMNNTPTYKTWEGMIQRCTNPKSKRFPVYGGRGISICDRWLKFENFYEDMGLKPQKLTLDRIDNDGNYCKENCKWSTVKEQNNNTSRNHFITVNGIKKNITQWESALGVGRGTIYSRIKRGLSSEDAVMFGKDNDDSLFTLSMEGRHDGSACFVCGGSGEI